MDGLSERECLDRGRESGWTEREREWLDHVGELSSGSGGQIESAPVCSAVVAAPSNESS